MEKRLVGLDIETVDPLLKTQGYSWKYNQGYVLNTALYYEDEDKVAVVAGLNNRNCPYSEEERKLGNQDIKNLLTNTDVCIVGANLQYDLGWLLYEYGMSTYDVKCSLIDVLQAEAMLDEFSIHSLEEVSWKYLKYGKQKDKVEEWVLNNVPRAKGDFRKYLEQVPYNLLCEYVQGDAKNPVKVWRAQFEELKKQELVERAQLEFDCLLPTLQMTMTGIPFDDDLRRQMLSELIEMRDIFKARFEEKVGKTGFNVNSSAQIASVCDRFHIPYNNKITLKSYNGKDFKTRNEKKAVLNSVKRIVSSFRIQKGFIIAYVPHEMAERTELLLSDEGYTFNSSPNLDKHFMAARRDEYEIIADIADWKQANSIISKILGESYARFVCPDGKMRPQFRITDTISFRFSSVTPNCQQIPSKNMLKVGEHEFPFASLRRMFHAEKGCVFGKIDYGQIEYRLICNIACGEAGEKVRAEYAKNPKMDFHQYVVDLTGLSRKYAKNMSFGVSFGMGLKSMAEAFGWSIEKAEEISEKYHEHMPFVRPTLALVGDVAERRGYIKTVCKSHARLPDKDLKYTMLNRYTQGSGAECMKSAIVKAYREGVWKRLRVANDVHDEINSPYVEPTEQGVLDLFRMAEIMRTAVPLRVPLEATPEVGTDWYNVREVAEWIELRDKDAKEWHETSSEVRDFVNIASRLLEENRIKL